MTAEAVLWSLHMYTLNCTHTCLHTCAQNPVFLQLCEEHRFGTGVQILSLLHINLLDWVGQVP